MIGIKLLGTVAVLAAAIGFAGGPDTPWAIALAAWGTGTAAVCAGVVALGPSRPPS